MSRSSISLLATQSLTRPSKISIAKCPFQAARCFSQSAPRFESNNNRSKPAPAQLKSKQLLQDIYGAPQASTSQTAPSSAMANLSQALVFEALGKSNIDTGSLSGAPGYEPQQRKEDDLEPFHFHVYSHKHNTHITCTKPNRDPIISLSCGNVGFRKSRRGNFDAAYSLTKYVLERLIHNGWPMKISRLELVLQGFGQGREAAVKVLMSPEGKVLRDKIVRVADSTKIKFAGTRSEKPRRL